MRAGRSPKVAYLVSQYPAPSHTFIRREIEALRKAGVDIETFSIRAPQEAELKPELDRRAFEETWYVLPRKSRALAKAHLGALVRKPKHYLKTLVDASRHRTPGLKSSVWGLFYFVEAVALAEELERRGITHLHTHFANSGGSVGYLASRLLNVPWSLTIHGTADFDYPAGVLLPDKIRYASWVACVSDFGRAQAMRVVDPVQWAKLFVARCGVDVGSLPQRPTSHSGPLRLLCIGRLSPEKGLYGLLDAFAKVAAGDVPAELRLVGDGPEGTALQRYAERIGVADRVVWLGRLGERETLEQVASSDLLVSSSLMEGLPVVLMEALALGVPVIAPAVGGVPELVEDGRTGLLFPAGNWKRLEQQLQRLVQDKELRQSLAVAGQQRVFEEFAIDVAVRPLAERFGVGGTAPSNG